MTFQVILHRHALLDLSDYFEFTAKRSREAATEWLTRFKAALKSLEHNPERCGLAWENGRVPFEVREFLFGKRPNVFRTVFTVDGDAVRILRIRRSARDFLTAEQLKDAHEDAP